MIGFGCMRLSTDPARDEERGMATLLAALDAGATLFDTADAYALDDADRHHNERLIARAIEASSVDRARLTLVTKIGMTRPNGRWVPDGRAAHLLRAAAESRDALGAPPEILLLHAPDPRVPLATSVRALAEIAAGGLARAVGLSNVTVAQIREAQSIVPVAAVEIGLGPFDDDAIRGGVVEHCRAHEILVLAHSPLGGPKRAAKLSRDPALRAAAERHGVSAQAIAVAWLRSLAPGLVPIPGARDPDRARDLIRGAQLRLDDETRAAIDARHPAHATLRQPRATRRPPDEAPGDVVVIMGIPGAGKSELARELVARGYERLNRDERGGTLRALLPLLDAHLAAGRNRVVLDNTYPTRALRNEVIEVAWRHGVPARVVVADASLDAAQTNAVRRLIRHHGGTLPSPEEIARRGKRDPIYLAPTALMRVRREIEPPDASEGWRAVDRHEMVRRPEPGHDRPALFVALDALAQLGSPPSPATTTIASHARETILAHRPAPDAPIHGYLWAPAIARGQATPQTIAACTHRIAELLDLPIETAVCPHGDGPPICWCRPPMPGLVVAAMERDRIAAERSVLLGHGPAHAALARGAGLAYVVVT